MPQSSVFRNEEDVRSSSRFATVQIPTWPAATHRRTTSSGMGRAARCVSRDAANSKRAVWRSASHRYLKVRTISFSLSEAKGPLLFGYRSPILVVPSQAREGRTCMDSAGKPRPRHRTLSLGQPSARPRRNSSAADVSALHGSSMGLTVSKFGKLVMRLLLSWRRFLADRSQHSSMERNPTAIPCLQLPVLNSCLRPRLLGP